MNLTSKSVARMMALSVVAGALGMLVDWVVYILLNFPPVGPYWASNIGIALGTIVSFIFNVLFIFKVRDRLILRFILFFVTGIFGMLLTSLILWLGGLMQLPADPVKLFSIFFVALVQFFLNLFGSFGRWLNIETQEEAS
ncbi:MAG: GtrA family protein [Streptococcaceae bacterium]|jgi:putative flippase GtrA|nr:GtrA family protein [Streptococcaceae bacterium]